MFKDIGLSCKVVFCIGYAICDEMFAASFGDTYSFSNQVHLLRNR